MNNMRYFFQKSLKDLDTQEQKELSNQKYTLLNKYKSYGAEDVWVFFFVNGQ